MNEGRIQQIGTLRDIYRRASNQFVAEFIGGNNILIGRVCSTGPSGIVVETEVGSILAERYLGNGIREGQTVTLVLPADRIAIAPERRNVDNEIPPRRLRSIRRIDRHSVSGSRERNRAAARVFGHHALSH